MGSLKHLCLNERGHKITFNVNKIKVMKFCTNSKTFINPNIGYDNKTILFHSILVKYFQLHNSIK
jgi:hypothetical protein